MLRCLLQRLVINMSKQNEVTFTLVAKFDYMPSKEDMQEITDVVRGMADLVSADLECSEPIKINLISDWAL